MQHNGLYSSPGLGLVKNLRTNPNKLASHSFIYAREIRENLRNLQPRGWFEESTINHERGPDPLWSGSNRVCSHRPRDCSTKSDESEHIGHNRLFRFRVSEESTASFAYIKDHQSCRYATNTGKAEFSLWTRIYLPINCGPVIWSCLSPITRASKRLNLSNFDFSELLVDSSEQNSAMSFD